jgi:hypothetical protein
MSEVKEVVEALDAGFLTENSAGSSSPERRSAELTISWKGPDAATSMHRVADHLRAIASTGKGEGWRPDREAIATIAARASELANDAIFSLFDADDDWPSEQIAAAVYDAVTDAADDHVAPPVSAPQGVGNQGSVAPLPAASVASPSLADEPAKPSEGC